jgi:hypothetical protein
MLLLMTLIVTGYIKTEFTKKPHIKNMYEDKDYESITSFYFSSRPHYNTIPYYGNDSAQIHVVVYADLNTDYLTDSFGIFEDYINSGRIKYYHIPYVEELNDGENFKYAQFFSCVDKNHYYDLFFNSRLELETLQEKYNISTECLNQPQEDVIIWLSEIQNRGMVGTSPWIHIGLKGDTMTKRLGVYTPTQLENTIRNLEIKIGI